MTQQINLDQAERLNIITRRGDTFDMSFEMRQNGVLEDVSTSTFRMVVSYKGDPRKTAVLEFQNADFLKPFTGTLRAIKTGEQMKIPAGYYHYDLQQTAPGNVIKTRYCGDFTINNDITP